MVGSKYGFIFVIARPRAFFERSIVFLLKRGVFGIVLVLLRLVWNVKFFLSFLSSFTMPSYLHCLLGVKSYLLSM